MNEAPVFARAICLVTGVCYAAFGAFLFVRPDSLWSRVAPISAFKRTLHARRRQPAVSHFLDGIGSTRPVLSDLAPSTIAVLLVLATVDWRERVS
jgi:hypothetical protein